MFKELYKQAAGMVDEQAIDTKHANLHTVTLVRKNGAVLWLGPTRLDPDRPAYGITRMEPGEGLSQDWTTVSEDDDTGEFTLNGNGESKVVPEDYARVLAGMMLSRSVILTGAATHNLLLQLGAQQTAMNFYRYSQAVFADESTHAGPVITEPMLQAWMPEDAEQES